MSKALPYLVGAQTLLLLFLTFKLIAIENKVNDKEISLPSIHKSQESQLDILSTPVNNNSNSLANSDMLVRNLREAIREELKQLNINSLQNTAPQPLDKKQTGITEKQELAYQAVQDTLDTFVSLGTVNQAQLERFHSRLGQLTNEDRKDVIRRFTLAVNSGTIKISR